MSRVLEALDRRARRLPDSLVIETGTEAVSAEALRARVIAMADRLRAAGSATLGLAAGEEIEWIVADLAAVVAGAVCVPVPAFLSAEQRSHLVAASGIDTWIGDEPPDGASRLEQFPPSVWRLYGARATLPRDIAKITFTSGTTGRPKGVLLRQSLLESVAAALADHARRLGIRRHLCALPLAVLLENVAGVYAALLAGITLLFPRDRGLDPGLTGFEPERLAHAIDHLSAHSVILLPQMLIGLTAWAERSGWSSRALRMVAVGGAPIAVSWLERARTVGLPVHQGYGMSECGSVITLEDALSDPPGTCGRPLAGRRLRLGARGEIEVLGSGFAGYLGGQAPSTDGWWRTGDRGRIDAQGRLSVLGRLDNVIVTSMGRNVSPEWLELKLGAAAPFEQVVVLGPDLRVLIHAAPQLSDEHVEMAILAANEHLPPYAAVRAWLRLGSPLTAAAGDLTANGRPCRRRLEERYPSALFRAVTQTIKESA